jgi:glycolate oxidase FAD binding subunit
MTTFRPANLNELRDVAAWAVAEQVPLRVHGHDSKAGIGPPVVADHAVDLSALGGVTSYEPEELVLTAGAATPMSEIQALLDQRGQLLAFEPPDLGALFGGAPGRGTLGGVLAANLSGPRRFKAGAARDHFLGVSAVSGRGEIFKAGGRVVKNVTGYDLCKLLAGSWGTLALMAEVTVKVLPKPEVTRTLALHGLDPVMASRAMAEAAGSPHEPSGLAWQQATGRVLVRIEGSPASVEARRLGLQDRLQAFGAVDDLREAPWTAIGDVSALEAAPDAILWRLAAPPAQGGAVAARLQTLRGAKLMMDWGGALVWLALPAGDAHEDTVYAAAAAFGGHAVLWRAPEEIKRAVPVWPRQAPALAALTQRLRKQFDPEGVLNPGRFG